MQPNILLITLECLRGDYPKMNGGSVDMPFLESLGGYTFSRAYTAGPVTWISLASVMTGLWPWQHGLADFDCMLNPEITTLAEYLKVKEGYFTLGFPASVVVGKEMGFAKGFDVWEENFIGASWKDGESRFKPNQQGHFSGVDWSSQIQRFNEQAPVDKPWFGWFHYWNTHHLGQQKLWENLNLPDALMDKYGNDDKTQHYSAKIEYADTQIGRLVESIMTKQPDRPLLLIVYGDHGENFTRKPYPDHDLPTEEESRVFLFITEIGKYKGTIGINCNNVRLIDIMQTILSEVNHGYSVSLFKQKGEGVNLFTVFFGGYQDTLTTICYNGKTKTTGKEAINVWGDKYIRVRAEDDKVKDALKGLGYIE